MFIRYDVNYAALTNAQAWYTTIMGDIVGALNGTITTPAGFNATACNTATSKITGGPLSSIKLDDNVTAAYGTLDWNSSVANALIFTKKHSAYNSANSYTPQTYHHIYANSTTYGFRHRASATTGTTGMYPDATITNRYWMDGSAGFGALTPNIITRIHVYASKYWFIIQMVTTSGRVYTSGNFDFESTLEDIYHFKQNAYSVPNIAFTSELAGTVVGAAANNSDRIFIARSYYPNIAGAIYSSTPGDGYGPTINSLKYTSAAGSYLINPAPGEQMYQNYADGLSGLQNKLTPVFVEGYGYNATYSPAAKVRKISEFYRTTDDFLANGDVVTINGTNYRCLIIHKTTNGATAANINDATYSTRNACYLVPETIGGV